MPRKHQMLLPRSSSWACGLHRLRQVAGGAAAPAGPIIVWPSWSPWHVLRRLLGADDTSSVRTTHREGWCGTDLEKDASGASAARRKFSESEEILGENHSTYSKFWFFLGPPNWIIWFPHLKVIYSPNFALFWGKHLISPLLGGTTLPNLGEISQKILLGKFSLKKAARGKYLTYSKSSG